ncbi:protein-methionine-sulfoxide reductase heme-binding subunit MsrQ [Neptunomonas sp. XY-337]|uniref:sulfite oxidase heme-binding subunit YedZ n=1 Tax=Neptunomonas sp. XY-337 TaxID=2561897 RepID=UPI0010A997F1|nr:protein-methionine-sulfoxide reductase heme-binding subunit MsrQ [Neptunomonas sp. XY-337]
MVLTRGRAAQLCLWWGIFLVSLVPLLLLVSQAYQGRLGADPAKEIVLETGLWAAVFLWLSLWVTPLRRRIGVRWVLRFRRMLGLYAFFYAVLHSLAFATFIAGWRFDLLIKEITERPFIIVGMLSLLGLVPLAATSTKKMQKRLGKRWSRLHKTVYSISLLVLLHIVWMVRASYFDAIVFGVFLLVALGERSLYRFYRP